MLSKEELQSLADDLVQVDGVAAAVLGGSRARGDHAPDSDVDIGLYYEGSIDLDALAKLARRVAGPDANVTAHGAWGHWVDGGAWLSIKDTAVDWIYRDLGRVRSCWRAARRGEFAFHIQAGHPLGVPDFAYAGELALGKVLADPTGKVTSLREQTTAYPIALGQALVEGLWEADFSVGNARKAVSRADTTYVAGCLFRALLLCAHALHGQAGSWLINEKGAIAAAGRLSVAPRGFAPRAHRVLADLGGRPDELRTSIDLAQALIDDVRAVCRASR